MANTPSSTVPGLSQDIYNLRRPLNTNVYYSCSLQDWDNLCRSTLVHDAKTKEKAIAALVKKSKAGKIHETNEGEQAQVRCTNCNKGGNGAGHPCYLAANSTARTCAHCVYTNKSKCDAQRAPPGSNNSAAGAAPPAIPQPAFHPPAIQQPAVHQPAVAAPYNPPYYLNTAPAAAPPTLVYPPVMNAASTQYPPPPFVPGYTHAFIRPSASRPINNPDFPIEPLLARMSQGPMTNEDLNAWSNMGVGRAAYIVRRDQGEDQGDDQEEEQGENQR